MTIAWHYTTGEHFQGICRSMQIDLETGPVLDYREQRCVWFTTAETYEATALKARVGSDGSIHQFQTAAEQSPFCRGLVRIGVPAEQLFPYRQWRERAHVHPFIAEGMESIAILAGSDPHAHWHFTCKPVPSSGWVAVEFSIDGERWFGDPLEALKAYPEAPATA